MMQHATGENDVIGVPLVIIKNSGTMEPAAMRESQLLSHSSAPSLMANILAPVVTKAPSRRALREA